MNNINNWITHLQHPLVLAGFVLFVVAVLIRPLFLNSKKLSGTAIERLLHKGINFIFLLALLALISGFALSWKSTSVEPTGRPAEQETEKIQDYGTNTSPAPKEEVVEQKDTGGSEKKILQDLRTSGTTNGGNDRDLLEKKLQDVLGKMIDPQDNYKGSHVRTIEECFDNAATLNEQLVRVRGTVVKLSYNIMGKNWLHIQDGTGNSSNKNHDLVVTTLDQAKVGTEVTVEGVLFKDKDFGAGYRYSALIENANIVR